MKNYFKYISILALGIVSCEPELENSIEDEGFYASGEADFTNYVALGNSLTAGYADGALYITGQENSYPNILAQKFALVQETNDFTIPFVDDNTGGLLLGGNQITQNRFVLSVGANGPAPARYTGGAATTDVANRLTGPFNNMGVPGAKSFHLLAPGYGNVAGVASGASNPYFARFASTDNATVLQDALAQDPTFFTLWIGNNDVLGYATDGGTGVFQSSTDVASYGPNDITAPNAFAFVYNQIVEQLAGTADGVLINIPDVSAVPYFTTVPNNALALDAATAGQLTGYFQAVSGVFAGGLVAQGIPAAQAQALASQYAITFNEGDNRFIIDVPVTQANPLGFRQATADELLVLTIDQNALRTQGYGSVAPTQEIQEVLAILQGGGSPTPAQAQLLFSGVNGLDDKDVLDAEELMNISNATTAYNAAIANLANTFDLGLVDANSLLKNLKDGGLSYDGGSINSTFVTGGAFSLDGIHLTPRGNAVIANAIIDVINSKYGANVPKANPGIYGTVTLSQDVQ